MMSLRELDRAAETLDSGLRGARVQRVTATAPRDLWLVLRDAGREQHGVQLCVEPARARLLQGPPPKGESVAAAGFVDLLRARLKGQTLRRVELPWRDRLIALRFDNDLVLMLAVMGPRSNLLLLDESGRVLGSLRPLAETHRGLRPGGVFAPPETVAPREGEDRFADLEGDAWWDALRAHYDAAQGQEREDALHKRVARALRKARQALEKKRTLLEGDARAGDEALRLRRDGERLKGLLGILDPVAREASGTDYETGEPFTVVLEEGETPRAAVQRLFAKARKAEKRALRAGAGLAELAERDTSLAELETRFAACEDDPAALDVFAASGEMQTTLGRFAPERRPAAGTGAASPRPAPFTVGKRELPRRLWPRRYRSADGLEIWVGRSDEGNDILSTRLARGKDLFFHLDASPGSHVILRTEGRGDPPSESMLDAAELAVHFSKARAATRADVHVAPGRLVRKPKGAKPGLVSVSAVAPCICAGSPLGSSGCSPRESMRVDFGRAAGDYALHRAGFPDSFFERVSALGLGRPGQTVVDLGTGTGTLARGFARRGCRAIGIDPSPAMLESARHESLGDGVAVEYHLASAEDTGLEACCADFVCAGQCWHWFDRFAAAREVGRIATPGGRLLIAHFDWIPLPGNLADATEALIRAHATPPCTS